MTRLLLLIIFLSAISRATPATVIYLNNKEYSGKELRFFKYSDVVTKNEIPAFSLKVDTEGHSKKEITVKHTTYVFCDFGIYRGMLFLEPDKTIELLMPPLREKSFADEKNPFFDPVEFWFSTGSGNNLTDKISHFDAQLNRLTDKFFNQLYFRQSEKAFDSIASYLDQNFDFKNSETLYLHKKLKLKSIETDVLRLDASKNGELMSSVDRNFHLHPAFIELFDKLYTNKLSLEIKSAQTNKIYKAVSASNTALLIEFIKNNYRLNGTIVELALLKMLHDAYYSGDFPQNTIIKILDSDVFASNSDKYIRDISLNVLKKLKFLRKGSRAPAICLKNTDGQEVRTNENNGKFKYLIFADIEMMVCREHLKYLRKIEEKYQKYIKIYIILRKTGLIEMKMFLDKQDIPGVHLVDEKGKYIEKYKVRSFPVCFLLNEDHEVVFRQTKAPLDGFEQQFEVLLRSGKYQN